MRLIFATCGGKKLIKVIWDRLTGENDQMYSVSTYGDFITIWDPRMHWAIEANMPLWTKEREAGIRDFKGKGGNV